MKEDILLKEIGFIFDGAEETNFWATCNHCGEFLQIKISEVKKLNQFLTYWLKKLEINND